MLLPQVASIGDAPREVYNLWQVFTHPATGHYAVAVSTVHANILISMYTILIGLGVAFTWVILVSLAILFLTPRKMTRTTYIALITAWSQSEPWTASWVLGKHSWHVFWGAWGNRHPAELTWSAFRFDMALLTVALLTAGGGIALGPLFSRTFTVGNIAPANPKFVYLPLYDAYQDGSTEQLRVQVEYDGLAALKAFRSVDGIEAGAGAQQDIINVESEPLEPVNGEERYSLQYSYRITGADMGLQKLRDLTLEVSGNCTFQDTWWYGSHVISDTMIEDESETLYDVYINWNQSTLVQYPDVEQTPFDKDTMTGGENSRDIHIPVYPRAPPSANFYGTRYTRQSLNQDTGRSYFVIIPLTARIPTVGPSTDPWYATRPSLLTYIKSEYPEMVGVSRPPLLCQENNQWSFRNWKGTMGDLISKGADAPPFSLPIAIQSILQSGLGIQPMMMSLGRALKAASLQSVTRLVGEDGAIDTQIASARGDIRRLVHASYLATIDLFRDAAAAGSVLQAKISSGDLPNALVDSETGKPAEGAGDFVVTSSAVRALSLRALISIPILVFLLGVIVILSQAGRKVKAHNVTSGAPGRLDRYIKLVTGLKATQLYRIIDQLLADRAPSDLQGWDSKHHKSQAQWTNQTGDFPLVTPNERASPKDKLILPYFHVQVKGPVGRRYEGKDQRLTLDVTRYKEDMAHWRSLRPGDGDVRLDHLDRQKEEEQEFRINDEYSQMTPLIRNHPTTLSEPGKKTSPTSSIFYV